VGSIQNEFNDFL